MSIPDPHLQFVKTELSHGLAEGCTRNIVARLEDRITAATNLVTSQLGRTDSNLKGDLDGNGVVNSTDRLFSTQQRGKKLLDYMLGFLDD